jgi:hypothetical protein
MPAHRLASQNAASNSGQFMSTLGSTFLPAIALLALPVCASAQEIPHAPAAPAVSLQPTDQVIYKGLVGNVLDNLPMDPAKRANLQRTNAVLSNTFAGRSLGALAGVGGPALMIVGLVWGMWAASNINPAVADTQPTPAQSGAAAATRLTLAAVSDNAPTGKNPDVMPDSRISSAAMTAALAAPEAPRPRVIRVWLPQRADEPRGWSNDR